MEQHQLLQQRSEVGSLLLLLQQQQRNVSGKARTHEEFLSEMYDQKGVYDASYYD